MAWHIGYQGHSVEQETAEACHLILYQEGATEAQIDEAHGILEVLTTSYPGHPWAVRVYDGGFFIRNLSFPHNWGMNCKFKDVGHDGAVMKREIILMAGEWLERAGLKRGRYDADQEVEYVEGVPAKYQPLKPERPLKTEHAVIEGNGTEVLRETPRPQVLRKLDG